MTRLFTTPELTKADLERLLTLDVDDPTITYAFPATADFCVIGPDGRVTGSGQYEQLAALARERMIDPSILAQKPELTLAFVRGTISTDALDSYKTRMAESSLRNYAEDANARQGVAVLTNHYTEEIVGRSILGQYYGAQGNGVARVEAVARIVDGLAATGFLPATGPIIDRIRIGDLQELSIGFMAGGRRCSICNGPYYQCSHYAGMTYPVGQQQTPTMAFVWIDDARLREFSFVYKGATPGASVIKAYRAAQAGQLDRVVAAQLEARYRCFPAGALGSPKVWALGAPKEASMGDKTTLEAAASRAVTPETIEARLTDDERVAVTSALARVAGIFPNAQWSTADTLTDRIGKIEAAARTVADRAAQSAADLASATERLTEAEQRLEALKPVIADAEAYRAALLDQLAESSARLGATATAIQLNREQYATAPLDRIRALIAENNASNPYTGLNGRVTRPTIEGRAAETDTTDDPTRILRARYA